MNRIKPWVKFLRGLYDLIGKLLDLMGKLQFIYGLKGSSCSFNIFILNKEGSYDQCVY